MNKRELQKAETRRTIYECAIRLFMEHPYDTVKITDIAKAAKVSVGAFYYHFPAKDNLIDEGYRCFDQVLAQGYEQDRPKAGIDAARYLIHAQLQDVERKGVKLTGIFFKNQLGIAQPYLFDTQRFFYAKLCENIGIINKTPTPSETIAESVLRASRGAIYDWCLHGGSYDIVAIGMNEAKIQLEHFQLISKESARAWV